MANPWILPGVIGAVYWVAPAAWVSTTRASGFHQAALYLNWRIGWACQKIRVPTGSPTAMVTALVTAATASQVRAGCRLAQAAIRRSGGSRRAGPRPAGP